MRSFFLQKLNDLAPLATAVLAVGTVAFLSWTAPEGPLIGAAQSLGRVGLWSAVLVVGARLGAWIVGSRLSGWSHLTWDGAVGM